MDFFAGKSAESKKHGSITNEREQRAGDLPDQRRIKQEIKNHCHDHSGSNRTPQQFHDVRRVSELMQLEDPDSYGKCLGNDKGNCRPDKVEWWDQSYEENDSNGRPYHRAYEKPLLRVESGKQILKNGRHEERDQPEAKQLHGRKRRQEPCAESQGQDRFRPGNKEGRKRNADESEKFQALTVNLTKT